MAISMYHSGDVPFTLQPGLSRCEREKPVQPSNRLIIIATNKWLIIIAMNIWLIIIAANKRYILNNWLKV